MTRDHANDSTAERIFWKLLLRCESRIPVRYLRPVAAKVLTCQSKTRPGYERACERLVDPACTKSVHPQPLTPAWWITEPVVKARRLGLELSLDLRDNVQRCLYFTGTYEPDTLAFLRAELRAGDTFIDVGAHVGLHSLVASTRLAELGGGATVAFEPTPDSAANLRRNSARNRLDIALHEVALGSRSSRMPMFGDSNWGIHDAGVRSLHGAGPVVHTVDVVAFDDWNARHSLSRIDLIKIDAEGAEYDVITGMSGALQSYRPRCIVMELKDSVLHRAGTTRSDLMSLMTELGYRPDGAPFERNQVFRPDDITAQPGSY